MSRAKSRAPRKVSEEFPKSRGKARREWQILPLEKDWAEIDIIFSQWRVLLERLRFPSEFFLRFVCCAKRFVLRRDAGGCFEVCQRVFVEARSNVIFSGALSVSFCFCWGGFCGLVRMFWTS